MQRFLLHAAALLLPLAAPRAQAQLGQVPKIYPFGAAHLLADPSRPRIYASVPATNTVNVLDTHTFEVVASIPVGNAPGNMALSSDDNTLYVANRGSALTAINLIDLTTLRAKGSFSLPTPPDGIAVGAGGRLFASSYSAIYQLDATTGARQAVFSPDSGAGGVLATSLDRRTLYAANDDHSAAAIASYDVSTPTARLLQQNASAGSGASRIVVSHDGKYLCLSGAQSKSVNPSGYLSRVFSTADLSSEYGAIYSAAYPGPLAFSGDDALIYRVPAPGSLSLDQLEVYDALTLEDIQDFDLTIINGGSPTTEVLDTTTDHTGSYLFVTEELTNFYPAVYRTLVLATGLGSSASVAYRPIITTPTSGTAVVDAAWYGYILAANSPTSFGATGLPEGLTVDTATGKISGVLVADGTFNMTISATNAIGTATSNLTLTVSGVPRPTVTVSRAIKSTSYGATPAVFVLNRDGDTTSDIYVSCSFGGTATNGVDYDLLPTLYRIKAGASSETIDIDATSVTSQEAKKTVKLTVIPGTGYRVGATVKKKVKIYPVSAD